MAAGRESEQMWERVLLGEDARGFIYRYEKGGYVFVYRIIRVYRLKGLDRITYTMEIENLPIGAATFDHPLAFVVQRFAENGAEMWPTGD